MANNKYDYRKIADKELCEYIHNENAACQHLVIYGKLANDMLSMPWLKR